MSPRVCRLVMHPAPPEDRLTHDGRVEERDLYDLAALDLSRYAGLLIGGGADQRHLAARREQLEEWIGAGGRVIASGHPVAPYLADMPAWRKLHFHGLPDIWLTALDEHPIWDGIDRRDFLLRTGVPGRHSFEELLEIGVGGFYAHAYVAELPETARVITGIGPGRLPVDVSYPLGLGEVIVHAGNDLLSFDYPGTSSAGLTGRILDHLEGKTAIR